MTKICENIYSNKNPLTSLSNRSVIYDIDKLNTNCIYYNDTNDNYICKLYSELLKTNFIDNSINIIIESAINKLTSDIETYVKYIHKMLSNDGYYCLITDKRLQKDVKNKLMLSFKEITTNERMIDDNTHIMYLNIFTK